MLQEVKESSTVPNSSYIVASFLLPALKRGCITFYIYSSIHPRSRGGSMVLAFKPLISATIGFQYAFENG